MVQHTPSVRVSATVRRAAGLVAARQPLLQPLGVAERLVTDGYCHMVSRDFVAQSGGRLAHGWAVREQREKRGRYVHFEHHTAVRREDGALIDPNLTADEMLLFLPDPRRPYDFAAKIGWNNIIVAEFGVDSVEGRRCRPWTPLWVANAAGRPLFARSDRLANWKHVQNDAEAFAFLSERGFAPLDRLALAFLTNARLEADPGAPLSP